MKSAIKLLFLLLVFLLLANTVISDKIESGIYPRQSEMEVQIGDPASPASVDYIEMDLKLITLLFCIGCIGIAFFARRRIGEKKDEKDVSP